mmetsp:Transcript_48857/g.139894  ORF Transcript_48857/g.139894 Transcript_48857/m.139894 type:complete len:217 (+) Transcript_48857:1465-2115(+)
MERVCQVLTSHWVLGSFVHLLGPQPGAKDNKVVAVLADHPGKLLMVGLDHCGPVLSHRLVEDFEEDVVVLAICRRHLVEKGAGLRKVLLSVVVMPVDDDIHAGSNRSFYDCANTSLLNGWILQVPIMLNCHGGTDECGIPVISQPVHGVACPELRHPLGPKERHAPQANRQARSVAGDPALLHVQRAVNAHCAGRGSWSGQQCDLRSPGTAKAWPW